MYHSLLIYWPIEECVGCFQVLALYYKHLCTDFCVNVSLLFFFKNKFIYLLAALGLRCCVRAFSSCNEWGATLRCGTRASHCSGFSYCGARALGMRASIVVTRRLSSCGSQALEHRLSSCGTRA